MPLYVLIREHPLYLLLALATVCTFVWLFLLRERLRAKWYAVLLLAVLHVFYGVLTVKAFAILEAGFDLSRAGAMSLFGAVFFMPPAYWLGAKLTKRPPAEVFDIFAVCMIFTLMCARCNCLLAGCCLGRQISGSSPLRWPTRETELLFYAVFLFLMVPRVWNGRTRGTLYPIYMIAYGAFRFLVEFFRVSATAKLFHLSHLWALLSLGLGISIYTEMRSKRAIQTGNTKIRKKRVE